ncbi:MAG: hypothetical protein KC431_30415, partial [Myxococcales bacterium]|nr:hypothetical protein [Myxococcales bacterium]
MAGKDSLTCQRCNATLALPQDPSALEMVCEYCGNRQLLPQHVVKQRRAAMARPAAATVATAEVTPQDSGLAKVMIGFAVAGGVFVAALLGFLAFIGSEIEASTVEQVARQEVIAEPTPTIEPTEPAQPEDPPLPPLPEETEDNNGLAKVRARMTALHQAGCDTVLEPPTRREAPIGATITLSKSSRHCVVVMGATDMPGTEIHLVVTDPLATPLET